jgi:hypothetical protein
MDPQVKRNKKGDKKKKTFDKYGVYTKKHIRVKQQQKQEQQGSKSTTTNNVLPK